MRYYGSSLQGLRKLYEREWQRSCFGETFKYGFIEVPIAVTKPDIEILPSYMIKCDGIVATVYETEIELVRTNVVD